MPRPTDRHPFLGGFALLVLAVGAGAQTRAQAPQAGMPAPQAGMQAPQAEMQAPQAGMQAPQAGAQTPPSAAAPLTKDPTQVRPGRYRLDPAHGKITWSVSHLGFSTYYGQITDVSGEAVLDPAEPARSRVQIRIGTPSLDGLNETLNTHLRGPDFLDAARFPEATFVSTAVEPTSPATARIEGTLTLKGVSRPVSFDATFNQAGTNPVSKLYTVGFDGWAVIRRSEFGVSAYLPAVGDEVSLRLAGEFQAIE